MQARPHSLFAYYYDLRLKYNKNKLRKKNSLFAYYYDLRLKCNKNKLRKKNNCIYFPRIETGHSFFNGKSGTRDKPTKKIYDVKRNIDT